MDNKGFLDPMTEEELAEMDRLEASDAPLDADEPKESEAAPQPDQAASQLEQPAAEAPVPEAEADKPVKTDPANSPDRPEGYVPAQALRETRDELKEVKGRLNRVLEAMATANAKRAEPEAKPEADPDPEPNREEDLIGHLQWENRQLQNTVKDLKGTVETTQQQSEHDRQFQAYTQELEKDAAAISDFNDAMGHLQTIYGQQLLSSGVPREQIPFYMRQKEVEIANSAYASGIKPAQMLYFIAQNNGYQPSAAPDTPAAEQPAPAAPAPQPAPSVQTKVDTRQKAANANASLSQLSGNTADLSTQLTKEQFAQMSEADLHKMIGQMKPDAVEQLLSDFP